MIVKRRFSTMLWRLLAILLLPVTIVTNGMANDIVAAAPGRVEGASDTLRLGSSETGIVKRLLVHEGSKVVKDQVLLELECGYLQQKLLSAKARAAASHAAFQQAVNGPRIEELQAAEANLASLVAELKEVTARHKRIMSLKRGIITTQAKADETSRDLAVARAKKALAEANLAELKNGVRAERIAFLRAQKRSDQYELAATEKRVSNCSIKSPIEGTILSTHITVGELVSISFPKTLVRLSDDNQYRVRAEVDEKDVGKICLGQAAIISADGFDGLSLAGRVMLINPSMGRRTILSSDPAEKADKDVLETVIGVEGDDMPFPIGLRVVVMLERCAGETGSAGPSRKS